MSKKEPMKKSLCLKWEPKKPSASIECKSPDFAFESYQYFLKLQNNEIYSLYIASSNTAANLKCDVTVHLKNRDGHFMPYTQFNHNVDMKNHCIWTSGQNGAQENDSDFLLESVFRFVVIVEKIDQSTPGTGLKFDDKSVQTSSGLNISPCFESLSEDFSKLLDEGSDPDVEFQCGNYTVKVHKSVLCTRSPVFASMLKSDMVEGKTGLVKIQDLPAEIFEQLLRYMYTGRLDKLTVDTATGLYEAGDKYAVTGLTRRCADFLIENLAVENACAVLAVSHAHGDRAFTEAAITYILAKRIPLMDDHWPTFCKSQPDIAVVVLNRFCKLLSNAPCFE